MKEIVLQPSFYNKFRCIGSDCKYNCCRDWGIGFKKQELKNIKRRIHTEEFRKIFENAFEKYREDVFGYKIKLDENNRCKFLDENGLCRIYKEVGEENMSLVCQIFPRETNYYMGKYECFLDISCEEVVRLLLEEKEGVLLEIVEREISHAEKAAATIVDAQRVKKEPILGYWTEIKMLLLGVLQNREYTFGERMVVLGIVMKKVDEMEKKRDFEGIKNYIQHFIKDFNDNKDKEVYRKLFENVDKSGERRAFQTITYNYIGINENSDIEIQKKIDNRIEVKRSLETEFRVGQGKKDKLILEYNTEKYQQAMQDFEEFIKDKEYWIENIMVEGFLSVRFPFRIRGGIWQNYCAMAIIYSAFLFMWTCCIEKDSTKEDFIYYTSEFARTLFNSNERLTELEEMLISTESNTLAHMALLLL